MASESSGVGILTSRSFVIGLAAGFVLSLVVLLGVASLVGHRLVEEVEMEERPPTPALDRPSLPDTTATTYGTVPEEWSLRSVAEGDTVSFAALSDGPIVLNVWATWCRPCRAELPTLQALHDSTGAVVLVSTESSTTAQQFLDRSGYSMPAYVTDDLPPILDGRAVPRTYVLDARRRIVHRHIGAADWNRPSIYGFLQRMQRP